MKALHLLIEVHVNGHVVLFMKSCYEDIVMLQSSVLFSSSDSFFSHKIYISPFRVSDQCFLLTAVTRYVFHGDTQK